MDTEGFSTSFFFLDFFEAFSRFDFWGRRASQSASGARDGISGSCTPQKLGCLANLILMGQNTWDVLHKQHVYIYLCIDMYDLIWSNVYTFNLDQFLAYFIKLEIKDSIFL